jgi:hypothetical protein
MKRFFLIVILLLIPTPAFSQPAMNLIWDMAGSTPTEAQLYIYRYYLDALPAVILQGVTCSVVNNVTTCMAPLPIPPNGTHTAQLTAANEYGESDKSTPYSFKYPALLPPPQNLRIVR